MAAASVPENREYNSSHWAAAPFRARSHSVF